MILVKAGDIKSYKLYCEDMYKRFPNPHPLVVKAFFVAELSDQKLFENAYNNAIEYPKNKNAQFRDWGVFHAGLAEYRKGNYNQSKDYCIRSMSASHVGAHHELALKALNNAVLSLVYFREGKTSQSKEALEIAKYNQKEMKKLKIWFHDTYLAEMLISERDNFISEDNN